MSIPQLGEGLQNLASCDPHNFVFALILHETNHIDLLHVFLLCNDCKGSFSKITGGGEGRGSVLKI